MGEHPVSEPRRTEEAPSPPPEEAGAEGTQLTPSPSGGSSLALSPEVIDQRHLGAVLHDYAETRSPLLAAVAVAAFEDARLVREALLTRLNQTETEKERWRNEYHTEREKRIASENLAIGRGPLDQFKQYAFGVGCLIAGIGVTTFLAKPELRLVGGLVTTVGILLLLLGAPFFHRTR
jgi:hypothetical protein